jgi:hypothetical protein
MRSQPCTLPCSWVSIFIQTIFCPEAVIAQNSLGFFHPILKKHFPIQQCNLPDNIEPHNPHVGTWFPFQGLVTLCLPPSSLFGICPLVNQNFPQLSGEQIQLFTLQELFNPIPHSSAEQNNGPAAWEEGWFPSVVAFWQANVTSSHR